MAEQPAQYGAVMAAVFAIAWGVFFWAANDVSVAVSRTRQPSRLR